MDFIGGILYSFLQIIFWMMIGSVALNMIREAVVKGAEQVLTIYLQKRKELLDDLEKRVLASNKTAIVRVDPNSN